MKNLKELYALQQKIADDYDFVSVSISDVSFGMAVYEKFCWALADKVFPEEELGVCGAQLRDDGCVYGSDLEDDDVSVTGDFISHTCLANSELYDTLFSYYHNSPYWDIDLTVAVIPEHIVEECGFDKDDESTWNLEQLLIEIYEDDFFEEACIELMSIGGLNPVNYFKGEGIGEEDECLVIKSYLLPYYLRMKNRELAIREHGELIEMVENSIDSIKKVFGDNFISVIEPQLEASYFISFSGVSGSGWCYPCGTPVMKKEILLAGMVIDKAIFELDSYYHFMPEQFRTKGAA